MSVIMKDQKNPRTKWPKELKWEDEERTESLFVKVIIALLIVIGFYALCALTVQAEPICRNVTEYGHVQGGK